jgi:hypothetical protein
MVWIDGSKYDGQWKYASQNGYGTKVWAFR